jgi:hypothetical protein
MLLAFCAAIGCGQKSADNSVHCRGRVTFRGTPIPKGRIEFIPDVAKGNRGSAGYALIDAGAFDTRSGGRAATPGPNTIRVQGFDGVPVAIEGGENGRSLFELYEKPQQIDDDTAELKIEVPAK